MRILLLHAWLTGNLGDVWHTTVLLERLRRHRLDRLDVSGFPTPPDLRCSEIVRLADHVHHEESVLPRGRFRRTAWSWAWERKRIRLFQQYDLLISVPGPFMRDGDHRCVPALRDLEVADRTGKPLVMACHSVGPLSGDRLDVLRTASAVVAREPATLEYLTSKGIRCLEGSDFAFSRVPQRFCDRLASDSRLNHPYGLVCLRFNNLHLDELMIVGSCVKYHGKEVWRSNAPRIVLGTSDIRRDRKTLSRLAKRCGVPCIECGSLAELWTLVSRATDVLSDRYHPSIAALLAKKPVSILDNDEKHKMAGLKKFAASYELRDVKALSENALRLVDKMVTRDARAAS